MTWLLPQRRVRRLSSLITTILDTIIDGVVIIDAQGRIQSFNKACEKLFGYYPEEVMGRNISMLMPEPYQSAHDGYLANYRRTQVPRIIGIGREVSGRRKDGSAFPMELAVGAARHGRGHTFVGIIRDLTERYEADKSREQLRHAQKMEALGQLTGGIAHDFNNLLAVIIGNLDFMQERYQHDAELMGFVRPCIKVAEHGAELTRQMLAFGRKQALQPRVISINELMEVFVPFVRHMVGERIELQVVQHLKQGYIRVDPTQLQNALLNLAVNARDAMPEGGKLVFEIGAAVLNENFISDNPEFEPGEFVHIIVRDTGHGMSEKVREKAFEPFFTTKGVGQGTGLGLSMVYGFVKQSRGHINLQSLPGEGTSVHIYLPRSEYQQQEESAPPAVEEKSGKARRILVVEDNPEVLKVTSAIVRQLGYQVLTAEHGDAARHILYIHQDIDMLLTDVMLPGRINGPELARRALILHPRIKVLFNSGYAADMLYKEGMLEKGVHLISKPFRQEELAARIQELLG